MDCDTLCKIFSNLLNIGRDVFCEVRRAWALGVVCCMLCGVQEEEGWSCGVFACTGIGSVPAKHAHSFGHCQIGLRRDGTV